MAINILLTTLFPAGKDEPLRYYYATEGEKRLYTDALLTVEATTKYILSEHHIDEILIFGRQTTFDAGDNERKLGVEDGKSFYKSDINELTTYSLFRYRLAQFIDDLKIEQEEFNQLLTPEEQDKAEAFIRGFFAKTDPDNPHKKFSRFFDRIVKDAALYEQMKKELMERVPAASDHLALYLAWIRNYLYLNLKETSKVEILDGNEQAKILFYPTEVDETGKPPIDVLLKLTHEIASFEFETVNLYVAMNNDNVADNFLTLCVMDLVKTLHSTKINLEKVYTTTNAHYRVAGMIRDDTYSYNMAELTSAAKVFLRYGKVDMIIDSWQHSASKNPQVEKMIYAMRRIDNGLALCSIGDIEKGISDLRTLFQMGFDLSAADYNSKLFILMSEGIKEDYGRLITADDPNFIDLVRWAYGKGFYQQCLTLIESKAPADFVERGIYYYCDDEANKKHVTDLFALKRLGLRNFEFWKMGDIDHYYLKYYFFFKAPSNNVSNQRANARTLVSILDNENPEMITACSACDDRNALEDLLFAYLHIGWVRNETNHANDSYREPETLFPKDSDISYTLIKIDESIRYFIQSYDKVFDNVKDKQPVVIHISEEEVKAAARNLPKPEDGEKR